MKVTQTFLPVPLRASIPSASWPERGLPAHHKYAFLLGFYTIFLSLLTDF
jgi:hypothetical protein